MVEVLYEDKHILVVVKPQGVPSQGDKTGDTDMLTMCEQYLIRNNTALNKKADIIWPVNRLDRPVGGVMLFAKTREACTWLSTQIQNKATVKKYLAVVNGILEGDGVLQDYLLKNERKNISRVVPKNTIGAKEAALRYESIGAVSDDNNGDLSLVMIELETGRHHQIRVQLANAGHPIFGDGKYNSTVRVYGGRQTLGLWSYSLSVPPMLQGRRTKIAAVNVKALPREYPFSLFAKCFPNN